MLNPDLNQLRQKLPGEDEYYRALELQWSRRDRGQISAVLGALIQEGGSGNAAQIARWCFGRHHAVINGIFGGFGHEIADILGYSRVGKQQWFAAIAGEEKTASGWIWHLHQPFLAALRRFEPVKFLFNSEQLYLVELDRLISFDKADLLTMIDADPAQHPDPPTRAITAVWRIARNSRVAAYARARAEGACEFTPCSHQSFLDQNGRFYREIHHIHFLGNGGLDDASNVACLCPAHHREAHHGQNAEVIRKQLVDLRCSVPDHLQGI